MIFLIIKLTKFRVSMEMFIHHSEMKYNARNTDINVGRYIQKASTIKRPYA